jgi:hypothetical protein
MSLWYKLCIPVYGHVYTYSIIPEPGNFKATENISESQKMEILLHLETLQTE